MLNAIETPPDTGVERRLDRLAATVWRMAETRNRPPDPGRLCLLDRKLERIEEEATNGRARHIADARYKLRTFAKRSNDVGGTR